LIPNFSQDGTGAVQKSWDWAVLGPIFGTDERTTANGTHSVSMKFNGWPLRNMLEVGF
jgi:hypothetical protein